MSKEEEESRHYHYKILNLEGEVRSKYNEEGNERLRSV